MSEQKSRLPIAFQQGLTRRTFLKGSAAAAIPALVLGVPDASARVAVDAAELVLINGRIATLDPRRPEVSAIAVTGGKLVRLGSDRDVLALAGASTRVIDLGAKRVVPGLRDHTSAYLRRGAIHRNETSWGGARSLAEGLARLDAQAHLEGTWNVVRGGWSVRQFAVRRLPTPAELTRVSPSGPVAVFHGRRAVVLNAEAVRRLFGEEGACFPGARTVADPHGLTVYSEPSGAALRTIASGIERELRPHRYGATLAFLAEQRDLGIAALDGCLMGNTDHLLMTAHQGAGLPIAHLREGVTLNRPWHETGRAVSLTGGGNDCALGADDFERFAEPSVYVREADFATLEQRVTEAGGNAGAIWFEGVYDEPVNRFLTALALHEQRSGIAREFAIVGGEMLSAPTLDRVAKLGGSLVLRNHLAVAGEDARERHGSLASFNPRRALVSGVRLIGGTDAEFVTGTNPWETIAWLESGHGVTGEALLPASATLSRTEALRLFTAPLTEGAPATLARLDSDALTLPPGELGTVRATAGLIDGNWWQA